mmetsp:Transcript_14974/g.45195  ORF Transcript_14974/g.45195 Transcript_14974/m.45195 type:complete len:201 (+) Transcript_14974:1396-1998(+)
MVVCSISRRSATTSSTVSGTVTSCAARSLMLMKSSRVTRAVCAGGAPLVEGTPGCAAPASVPSLAVGAALGEVSAVRSRSYKPAADTCFTSRRTRNRSYNASSSSLSGSSLLAPTRQMRGTVMRSVPLSNRRSLRMVSSVLRMALLALKISSMNATEPVGRYPSVCRTYRSSSRACIDNGPNSSSGTEKRVRRRSKKGPL